MQSQSILIEILTGLCQRRYLLEISKYISNIWTLMRLHGILLFFPDEVRQSENLAPSKGFCELEVLACRQYCLSSAIKIEKAHQNKMANTLLTWAYLLEIIFHNAFHKHISIVTYYFLKMH